MTIALFLVIVRKEGERGTVEHWLLGLQCVFFFLQDHFVMRISYVLVSCMSRAAYCSGLRLFEEHEGERYCARR